MIRRLFGIFTIVSLLVCVFGIQVALASPALPNVKILATGGTIAGAGVSSEKFVGYQVAVTPVDKLLQNVPELAKVANVSGEQICQISSQDINSEIWLTLAKRANELLASKDVDGIVVTHGTNTLEETSYFLNLVVKSDKPVVVVGAMRPGTLMSADGPLNLYHAVVVAGSKEARGRGVMIVMNNQIIGARDLQKTDTMTVDTFKGPIFGLMGWVVDEKPYFYRSSSRKHTYQSEFDVSKLTKLPQVDIVYGYGDDSGVAVNAFVQSGAKGIVVAGTGTAAISERMMPAVQDAEKKGVVVIRSPRTSLGIITRNMEIEDDKYGTVSGDTLNPPKARVLLMLALTKSSDPKVVQRIFDEY
jgi:L-asparaginase